MESAGIPSCLWFDWLMRFPSRQNYAGKESERKRRGLSISVYFLKKKESSMYIIMSGSASCDSPKRMVVSVIKATPFPSRCAAEELNLGDFSMGFPCKWPENSNTMSLSPTPSIGSTGSASPGQSPDIPAYKDGMRRGRPRAEIVRDLITEGTQSTSRIRCHICNRVFPREKSLQAHKRTHTGCLSKFTHANRHCTKHPYARLRRHEGATDQGKVTTAEEDKAVVEWLARYWQSREQRPSPAGDEGGTQKCDQEQDRRHVEDEEREQRCSGQHLQEQKERWHGALALIQLANLSTLPY
ncbi:zinc finger protein 367-like isoform X2 [Scyliorhinus torazame]|uniref:zinc finger protein 367-like isoform X2 n=1 Tax=Scyliorhinus torazame TaxID=75743 RepID=UPI003B5C3A6E